MIKFFIGGLLEHQNPNRKNVVLEFNLYGQTDINFTPYIYVYYRCLAYCVDELGLVN